MRWKNVWFVAALAICLCAARAPAADATASPQDVATLADGNNAFALDLYAQLAKTNSGNLFFSPYSIRTALAMTYAGARGETAEQMRKVLHFSLPDDRLHAAFAALAAELNNGAVVRGEPAYELTIANALWGQSGFAYNPVFLQLLRQNYGADLQQADFARATEQARHDVNQWVKQKTRDRIPEVLAPDVLDRSTRLVLVNAIYFKSGWVQPFEKRQTTNQNFCLDNQHGIMVPLMCKSGPAFGMENDDLQAVGLSYAEFRLSMVILLPRALDGLASLETQLNSVHLDRWLHALSDRDAQVYLPRFKLENSFELVPLLASMGMTDAFDSHRADFGGMTNAELMHINHVIHKTFIRTDEEGTEAAAATVVSGGPLIGPPPVMVFWANHPFVFLIRDESTGAILFMGRVTDPRE